MYLIIGSGRAAFHFQYYFQILKIPFLQWNRKQNSPEDLKEKLQKSQAALILISDSQIEKFASQFLSAFKGRKIHFSGALEIPGLSSAHPLMTFGPELYSQSVYEKIHFAVSELDQLKELLPELNNPSFMLKSDEKSQYHAWAAFSGNLAALLWKEAIPPWVEMGVPVSAIQVFLEQTLQNSLQDPSGAPTGALVRKDELTLKKHLSNLPPKAKVIYQKFIETLGINT